MKTSTITSLAFVACLAACAGGEGDFDDSMMMMSFGGEGTGAGSEDGQGTEDGAESEGDGDDESAGEGNEDEGLHEAVYEAMELFPDYPTLHEDVITRTCTPNEGVCHNKKEYPDLHTPASMLATISQPCNLDKDDPIDTFNGCEQPGDVAVLPLIQGETWESEVGYVEFVLSPDEVAIGARIHLRDLIVVSMPSPEPQTVTFKRFAGAGELAVGYVGSVTWAPGSKHLEVTNLAMIDDVSLNLLEVGPVGECPG